MNYTPVNRPAPLKNVAAFTTLIQTVVERRADLPGLACFYGKSGLGKTKAAIYGANKYRAVYVECGQFTSARSLLRQILQEVGVQNPRGTVTELIEDAVRILVSQAERPLIVDEAHWIAHKRFVDVLRELHDKSTVPVILIGEETLPKQLETFERVHNRILSWVQAYPCDLEDFTLLAGSVCAGVKIAGDLAQAIIEATTGNTRRIVVNLAAAEQKANQLGVGTLDLATFGGRQAIIGSRAPSPRGM
ncbi:AAA family ATPase [Paradevosia shaoguanensis]|uniref:ATP-binding protein n=1 Tax=Paradevosia shaoguanensis TaxID=1335043 RepID=A0AA41QRP7_9HYPH|nr:ATP-binding protein [Paradevosia shaoguanensis]MCF1744654.1 ATP-binding protein [Paradevosia shaoguanensis]MCI0129137.1 ATP-binding protein [Paradevosia shaoguanensis]